MNKSEIAEKARKRFAFEQYAKTVTWNTYEGDDDPFAFFPESGVYANGDIQLAWLGWQWRERAIAESQAPQPKVRVHLDCPKCGYFFEGWNPPEVCPNDGTKLELGDGEPSPPPGICPTCGEELRCANEGCGLPLADHFQEGFCNEQNDDKFQSPICG